MKIAVIDYNAGNIRSVYYALQRLGVDAIFTRDPDKIYQAGKVIFPGVGEASTTMDFLKREGLDQMIRECHKPILAVCLGMQLLCEWSEENNTDCIGVFPIKVKRFLPSQNEKVPHMGWNALKEVKLPLFNQELENKHVYFVHSYYVEDNPFSIANCQYTLNFSAAMQKDNYFATQFHPEKSSKVGQKILENFINL